MDIKKEPEESTADTSEPTKNHCKSENDKFSSNVQNNISYTQKVVESHHLNNQSCPQVVKIKQEPNDFTEDLQHPNYHFENTTSDLDKDSTTESSSTKSNAINKGFKIKYEVDCQWPSTDENCYNKIERLKPEQSEDIHNYANIGQDNSIHISAAVKCEMTPSNCQNNNLKHENFIQKLENNTFSEFQNKELWISSSRNSNVDILINENKIKTEFSNYINKVAVLILKRYKFFDQHFVCGQCFAVYRSLKALRRHKKNVHEAKKHPAKEFKCEICPYKGSYSHALARHVLIHSGEKPFKCDTCSYATVRSHALTIHKRIHTNETPYKCSMCPYVSKQFNSLKVHLLIHNSEKKLHCDMCNFKCKQPSNLKSHKLTHSYEKKVECNLCGKFYKTNNDLKRHQRIHSPEKPFKCDVCNFGFKHSSNLKSHKLIHTKAKPFCCDLCEFKCKRSTHLSAHKKTIHFKELPIEYVKDDPVVAAPPPVIDNLSITVL